MYRQVVPSPLPALEDYLSWTGYCLACSLLVVVDSERVQGALCT
jgi:hypothetical protein